MFLHAMAEFLVVLHFAFILFVVLGGLLALKWRWVILFHLPSVIWGALIEFQGWTCPLTPLEQKLRIAAGEEGYSGGFIQHYLLPVIYPDGLTYDMQLTLGSFVVVVNLAIYGWILIYTYRANGGD
jgi:hypothetical protein